MKKNWTAEAKRRIGADFELLGTVIITQRAAASERYRKMCGLSMTQLNKALPEQDSWLRTKLTRLNILEVVLARRKLLGKLVWWAYDQLMRQMKKPPKMRMGPAPLPAGVAEPKKEAVDGVAHEAAAEAVPKA